MKNNNRLIALAFIVIASFALSACAETWDGVKRDFGSLSEAVTKTTNNARESLSQPSNSATVIMQDKLCPAVMINPKLASITEFNDPEKNSDNMIVSKFKVVDSNTLCEIDGDYVAMQIDIVFEGSLGPEAKRKSGDKVFFSYPYFVAVFDLEGNQLAEEVFAASVNYDNGEEKKKMVETIRQRLPLEKGNAPYQIGIGFSLTEDQMVYNGVTEQK